MTAPRTWRLAAERAFADAPRVEPAARALKEGAARLFTEGDVGYHADPATGRVAVHGRGATADDLEGAKEVAAAAVGPGLVLPDPLPHALAVSGRWVKVGYSPALRRAGELLNFFPGRYPGGLPNAPSPLAALLTGALVGAGTGYGAGSLAERALPADYRRGKLSRSLALLGAAAGAAPGAAWLYSAHARGLSPTDGGDLATPPEPPASPQDVLYKRAAAHLELVEPHPDYAWASAKAAAHMTGRMPGPPAATPLDVNIDALGRTLWDAGADPRLYGVTMGAVRAAGAMPGGDRPGWVTPAQLGRFALAAGAGYAEGAAAGAVLGALTGLPPATQNALARGGALLNLVRTAVPVLLGAD